MEEERRRIKHCCTFLTQLRAIQERSIQDIEWLAVQGDWHRIQCLRTAKVQACLWEGHLRRQLPQLKV
jgi:hypothetical protein